LWLGFNTYTFVDADPLSGTDEFGLANSGLWKRIPGTTTSVRIDPPHVPGQQTHAHICTKGCPEIAINKDGTGSHGTKDPRVANKKVRAYLKGKGFNLPGDVGWALGDIWNFAQSVVDTCTATDGQKFCMSHGLPLTCMDPI